MRMLNIYHYLAQFDFCIKYLSNKTPQITAADALSRAISMPELEKLIKNEDDLIDDLFNLQFLNKEKNYDSTDDSICAMILRSGRKMETKKAENFVQNQTVEPVVNNPINLSDIVFKFEEKEFNHKNFTEIQKNDEFCSKIITKLEKLNLNGKPISGKRLKRKAKVAKYFKMQNGLLFNIKRQKSRLVLPSEISRPFIEFCHISFLHPGARSLINQIGKNVFVHKLHSICQEICYKCFTCIQVKPRPKAEPNKVSLHPPATFPFEFCSLDLIDYGKKDARGKRYLLVVVDHLSDFIDGIALASKNGPLVGKAIMELMLRHAIFQNIQSDNGAEFKGCFESITRKLNINSVKICPYNSRANRTERTKLIKKRSTFNYFGFHISNPFLKIVRNEFLKRLVKNRNFINSYLGKIYK